MIGSLRVLARNARATNGLLLCGSVRFTMVSCFPPIHLLNPSKRELHTERVPNTASVKDHLTQQTSRVEAPLSALSRGENLLKSDWRHPRFGFAATDLGHLIYIKLPRTATKNDVRVLAARAGLQSAETLMYYHFETGKPGDFCFLKIADKTQMNASIANLSLFTLLGFEIKAEKLSLWKAPPQDPSLLAGWLPSPSSDLNDRVIRPPTTEPPKLLEPLLREQWVAFSKLPVDLNDKNSPSKVAEAFYERFHQFDVMGITSPQMHRTKGKSCRILFGKRSHAIAARKLHSSGSFMGKPGKASTYRAGPEVHSALWNYRHTLREDMPEEEVRELLEEKFRSMIMSPAEIQRRKDYPTPESAVVAKDD